MDEETRVAMPGNLHPTNFSRLLQTLEIRSDAHEIPERKIAVITFSSLSGGGASASGGFEIRGQIDVDGDWRGPKGGGPRTVAVAGEDARVLITYTGHAKAQNCRTTATADRAADRRL